MLVLDNYSAHTKNVGKHQLILIFVYGSAVLTIHTYGDVVDNVHVRK